MASFALTCFAAGHRTPIAEALASTVAQGYLTEEEAATVRVGGRGEFVKGCGGRRE